MVPAAGFPALATVTESTDMSKQTVDSLMIVLA
jgi:hypothetical protein